MENDYSITMITCPAGDASIKAIIGELLEKGFAACIQEIPITSHYRWKGEVQHETEALLLIKGKASDFERIKETTLRLHPYDLPEIVSVPISAGLDRYLDWLSDPNAP